MHMKNERAILWHIPAVVCVMLEGLGRPCLAQGGSVGLEESRERERAREREREREGARERPFSGEGEWS